MVTTKLLNITFSSHSATHYKIADPALVREAIQAMSEPAPLVEHEMPDDLFDSIVGYPDVKTLVRYALEAEKPAHLLLSGPPASAKTMFLLELRRLPSPITLWLRLSLQPVSPTSCLSMSRGFSL